MQPIQDLAHLYLWFRTKHTNAQALYFTTGPHLILSGDYNKYAMLSASLFSNVISNSLLSNITHAYSMPLAIK